MSRYKRKLHHLSLANSQQGNSHITLFSDVAMFHKALTEVSPKQVKMTTDFLGQTVAAPIIINAITGGPKAATSLNLKLASLAQEFRLPMAVGSQTIALKR